MSSDEEDLSAEPRQLQPYMYEPLAAAVVRDSAATTAPFTTASDHDSDEDCPDGLLRNAESPSTDCWCVCLLRLLCLHHCMFVLMVCIRGLVCSFPRSVCC